MSRKAPQYIVDTAGKKKAVLLPVKEYESLMEDLHDLMVVAERREEPLFTMAEVKKKLKADGLL
jgi:PHD/YefM family antitoxin component YafN of YafNO toxin-antitoxin module